MVYAVKSVYSRVVGVGAGSEGGDDYLEDYDGGISDSSAPSYWTFHIIH